MDRSSKQLQELDSLRWLEACRSNLRRSPHLGTRFIVVSMSLSVGVKCRAGTSKKANQPSIECRGTLALTLVDT